MHGTFNGIHLDRITSITTEPAGMTTIRGIEHIVLTALKVNTPARLILADDEIEGVLIVYVADGHGYRITIESPSTD